MSALQDGPPALIVKVFWASTALRLGSILDKCYTHILGTIGIFVLGISYTWLAANDLRWATFLVLSGTIQSVYPLWEFWDPTFRGQLWTELKSLSNFRFWRQLFERSKHALSIRWRREATETSERNSGPQFSSGDFPILKRLLDAKTRSRAFDMVINGVLWVAMVWTFFRIKSPWRLSRTNWLMLLVYPRRRYTWIHLVHFALVAAFHRGSLLLLLARMYMWFLRVCRIAKFFAVDILFEVACTAGVVWVKSNRYRILWVIGWCVEELVSVSILDALLWGTVRLFIGSLDGNWRQYGPHWRTMLGFIIGKNLITRQWRTFPERTRLRSISDFEEPFSYTKLKDDGNIRLLLLHPRTEEDDIECSLFQIPLDKAPCYEAISYTWGTSEEIRNIRVNGHRLEVPKNTYNVLANRSSFWKPRLLWIDYICINQNEAPEEKNKEKSQQLKLMGKIYRKAFLVTVCLRLPDNPFRAAAEPAEEKLRSWGATVPEGALDEVMGRVEAFSACDMLEELAFLHLHQSPGDLDLFREYASQVRLPRWLAFQNLVRNPWFDRVWVIQEVSLASSIRVLYGRTNIRWQYLVAALHSASTNPAIASLLETTIDPITRNFQPTSVANIQSMVHFRRKMEESETGSISFASALFACEDFESKDPRDKIFGIQGFCKPDLDPSILPNYDNSTVDVYLAAAQYLLKQENPLRFLSCAGMGYFAKPKTFIKPNPELPDQEPVEEKLPSWCPDWSRRPRIGILSYRDSAQFRSAYQAGGEEDATYEIKCDIPPTFVLRGREIDTIVSLGPRFGIQKKERDIKDAKNEAPPTWKVFEMENEGQVVRESWKLIVDSKCVKRPYPYTEPKQQLRDVYWRTLCGDRTQTHRPAPASCGYEFEQWGTFQNAMKAGGLYSTIAADPKTPLPSGLIGAYGSAKFATLFPNCAFGRKLCITECGYIGAVPPFSRKGDIIYLIGGAQVPFVLRPVSTMVRGSKDLSSGVFELVGEAYVHGIMDEELHGRDDVPSWQDVNLV